MTYLNALYSFKMFKSFVNDMIPFLPTEPKRKRGPNHKHESKDDSASEEESDAPEDLGKCKSCGDKTGDLAARARIEQHKRRALERECQTHRDSSDLDSGDEHAAQTAEASTKAHGKNLLSRQTWYYPKEGDDVMVQLGDWGNIPATYRKKSFYQELHDKIVPARYTISGIGEGTYTFIRGQTKQGKPVSGELRKDDVILWLAEDVEEPELENGMLIEVQYTWPDGVERWSLLRYIDVLTDTDGTPRFVVTEDKNLAKLLDAEIYEFSAKDDKWRFPPYISLKEGEVIECFLDDAWQTVTVMEKLYDQTWMCEYAPRRSKLPADDEIEIDVYKTQIRPMESENEGCASEEYNESEVESDDDPAYFVDEDIYYNGVGYKITEYDNDTKTYTLTQKGGEDIDLTEDDIDNQWLPNFEINKDVLYKGRHAVITGIDWTLKAYIIEDAAGDAQTTTDVDVYTPLAYAVGRRVVYKFRYCEIMDVDDVNLRYTLDSCDVTFEDVSEDDLSEWCIFQEPKKAPIIYKIMDNKFQKAVKRGGKSVIKRHYKLLSEEESLKKKPKLKVAIDGDNIKKQSEVEAVYQDTANSEENFAIITRNDVGARVTYGGRTATVLSQAAENTYTIQVDGEKKSQEVDGSELLEINLEVAEEDRTRYNEGDYKYEGDVMWVVTSVVKGRIGWEVVEPEDGDDIVDVEGVQWKYAGDDGGWQLSGDDPTADTDEEEGGDYYEYDEQDIVYLDDNGGELYCVTSVGPMYTIESVTNKENTKSGITEERLQRWTPAFEIGDEVVVGDLYERRLVRAVRDGLYELDDSSEVAESDLSEYVKPIANGKLVQVDGKLYRVQSFAGGVYQLTRLMDDVTLQKNVDEVDEREVPDYKEEEWVVVKGEGNPKQVTKVNVDSGTYELSDKQILFESELEDAPGPKFGRFNGEKYVPDADQRVSVRDHQVRDDRGNDIPFKIKKILRGTRQYVVVDGREGRKKGYNGNMVQERTLHEEELYECASPEPDFEVGQKVLVTINDETPAQIKKVRPWAREYVLKDERIVHEDALSIVCDNLSESDKYL